MDKAVSQLSDEILLSVLAQAEHGIAILGPDGTASFCNDRLRIVLPKLDDQVTGQALVDVLQSSAPEELHNKIADKQPFTLEFRTLDDRSIYVRHVFLADGHRLYSVMDTTAQRMSEQKANEHAEQLEAVLEHVPHGVSYLDAEGRLAVANDEFFEAFDFPRDMRRGTPGIDFTREIVRRQQGLTGEALDQASKERLDRIYRDCMAGEISWDVEHLDDGRTIEIRRKMMPQGTLVETYIDVSERENALERAEAAVQRYRAVVEDQTEMICRFDEEFRITFANGAYRDAFQKPGQDLVGMKIDELIPEEDVRSAIVDRLTLLTPENPFFRDTFRETNARGDAVWQAWINRALFDEDGNFVEYQAVGRDVTAEREARDKLTQAEKLSAMGSLLASVSHELNNPLSILVGQSQLLEDISTDKDTLERAGRIRNAANRCARIVKTFLSMARQKPPVWKPVDMNEMLDEAISLVGYALRTSNVHVETHLPDEAVFVDGDRDQLIQVVVNILINAQQALSEIDGDGYVSLKLVADDNGALLEIADNGPGIDPKMIEKIFEPFFTTKEEGVGTGIGLAVCRNIILSHDGQLTCENGSLGGVVFRITLPLASEKAQDETRDHLSEIWASLPPMSILFVDDETGIADTAREFLEADGHSFLTAGNGREALDVLDREEVDVVITDLRMPVMGGPEFWRALEETGAHPTSAVGLVTGDALSPDIKRFLDKVQAPIAEKPLAAEDLRRLIVDVVSQEV